MNFLQIAAVIAFVAGCQASTYDSYPATNYRKNNYQHNRPYGAYLQAPSYNPKRVAQHYQPYRFPNLEAYPATDYTNDYNTYSHQPRPSYRPTVSYVRKPAAYTTYKPAARPVYVVKQPVYQPTYYQPTTTYSANQNLRLRPLPAKVTAGRTKAVGPLATTKVSRWSDARGNDIASLDYIGYDGFVESDYAVKTGSLQNYW